MLWCVRSRKGPFLFRPPGPGRRPNVQLKAPVVHLPRHADRTVGRRHGSVRPFQVADVRPDGELREPGSSRDHAEDVFRQRGSGAAPALTEYVLGVIPTAPGFAEFTVRPHVGDLKWAYGTVPTPHGPIRVSWQVDDGRLQLDVRAPAGTRWSK